MASADTLQNLEAFRISRKLSAFSKLGQPARNPTTALPSAKDASRISRSSSSFLSCRPYGSGSRFWGAALY